MHSDAELRDEGAALMQKAAASVTGESGKKLEDFGSHWLLLLARARTGEAEMHRLWADEIVVRSGELTLIVGGEMTGTHPYNNLPGEFHGSGLIGGEAHVLRAGDVAYVPANVPHWMKVEPGHESVVLIYKEKETSRPGVSE
jgi:mannose-6-phosphate isomerase-like protein (cupin superfamily)